MQETEFIAQNKDKWKEFEDVLMSSNRDPERVTELFIETTDDLSYSRTYYANRSVRVYLNNIAQQAYQVIYKNRKRERGAFMNFWMAELPDALWYNRKALYLSFLIFMAGLSIGVVSSIYYPEFIRVILPDSYIEQTKENISKGDPMAIYQSDNEIPMFFEIALNNITLSFAVFVMGLLFGVGTFYLVFYNAIMVGAFVYFFVERGLLGESLLAIMLHGTLELSMIVVAGAAGFAMARGLLFPGTYSRSQALAQSARIGGKIMISVAVFLVYAAIIESFLTRYTKSGDVWRIAIIVLSAVIVVGYFAVYPANRHKRGLTGPDAMEEIPNRRNTAFQLNIIKTAGRIFTESFDLFAANFKLIMTLALTSGLVFVIGCGLITHFKFHMFQESLWSQETIFDILYPWDTWNAYLNYSKHPLLFAILVIIFSLYSLFLWRGIQKKFMAQMDIRMTDVINSLFLSAVLVSLLLLPHAFTFLIMIFVFPFINLWMYVSMIEGEIFVATLTHTFKLLKGNYWRMIGVFLGPFAIQWIFLFVLGAPVLEYLIGFVTMNIPRNAFLAEQAYMILYTFLVFFFPACVFGLNNFSTALFYHSAMEINSAQNLMSHIQQIGFKKRAYGLEQEG
ncbi:MAG: stage II sporulation protein M [Flavobacteriales bacterium]